MEGKIKNKKVFVGVSGGVDSSVSALLLKEAGFDVTGVFLKVWQPDFIECTWQEEKRDAMRICAKLDIPFVMLDMEEEYKNGVAMYMINEYKNGRTPNPDVMCNREVKFGAFYKKARAMGADFIATGHYAVHEEREGVHHLLASIDKDKDQTYFLWAIEKEALENTLFPVGGYKKEEVRKIAEKNGLITANKKDSQGVCFLGKFDMKEFLTHYIKSEKGDVLNEKGEVVGFHRGALFYTLGERHGFTITKKGVEDNPVYIVSKDIENNTITVSDNPDFNLKKMDLVLNETNWFTQPILGNKYQARIRHRGELFECEFIKIEEEKAVFKFLDKSENIASGQSVVFYDGEVCLGGGVKL